MNQLAIKATASSPTPIAQSSTAPADTLAALVAEHDLHVVELPADNLPAHLRDAVLAFYYELTDGRRIIATPAGQDTTLRLDAVRRIIASLGVWS